MTAIHYAEEPIQRKTTIPNSPVPGHARCWWPASAGIFQCGIKRFQISFHQQINEIRSSDRTSHRRKHSFRGQLIQKNVYDAKRFNSVVITVLIPLVRQNLQRAHFIQQRRNVSCARPPHSELFVVFLFHVGQTAHFHENGNNASYKQRVIAMILVNKSQETVS